MAGIDMLAGVTVVLTESNDLSNSESVNESDGLYESDAEALIRLIDKKNEVCLCKENTMARDNTDDSRVKVESVVAESESNSHGFNTKSESRDKRRKTFNSIK